MDSLSTKIRQVTWPVAGVLLQIAKKLMCVRPLAPYPGWYFGVQEKNADLTTKIRLKVWEYFRLRRLEKPITIEWYNGLRFNVYLGNDLSRMLFVGGCVEPNEFYFLDHVLKKGMNFIDIGANDGIYALFAAHRVGAEGRVWAFEPSRREILRMKANLFINSIDNISFFPIALGCESGRRDLLVAGYEHEGQNTFGGFVNKGIDLSHIERVDVKRLDEVVETEKMERVDFIKIDTEGAEFAVLQGSEMTLKKNSPVIMLELIDASLRLQGSSAEQVLSLLKSLNYRTYRFSRETGKPVPAELDSEARENIVALHEDSEVAHALAV